MNNDLRLYTDLDECLRLVREEGLTPQEALDRFPLEGRAELEANLDIALALADLESTVQPSESFRARSAHRLMNRLQPHQTGSTWGAWMRIAAVVVLVAGLLGFTTIGLPRLADSAVPGDLLYGVDRFVERFQVEAAMDPVVETGLKLSFSLERLQEAEELIEAGRTDHLHRLMVDYSANMEAIEATLRSDESLQRESTARYLGVIFYIHQTEMAALIDRTPPGLARSGLVASVDSIESQQAQTIAATGYAVPIQSPDDTNPVIPVLLPTQ